MRSSRSFWGGLPLRIWWSMQSLFSSPMLCLLTYREHLPSHHPIPSPSPLQRMPTLFIPFRLALSIFRLMKPFFIFLVRRSYRLYEKGGLSHLHLTWIEATWGCIIYYWFKNFLESFSGKSGSRFRVSTWLEYCGFEIDWWTYWKIKALLRFDVVNDAFHRMSLCSSFAGCYPWQIWEFVYMDVTMEL